MKPKPREARHAPLREGELDRVLDEAVATGTDDEGGPRLDAVLHHHVCRDAARVEGNLKQTETNTQKLLENKLRGMESMHSISITAS